MDFFRNRYYRLNRLTLSISGLWPYRHWGERAVVAVVILIILLTVMLAMICKVLTTKISVDLLSYSIQFTVPGIVFISNLSYCFVNNAKLKALLEHIKSDWDLFQPIDTSIILKYAEMGRIYTLILTTTSVVAPIIQLIAVCSSTELSRTQASNGTYQLELPIPAEYFVDHEKNFYYILAHFSLAVILGLFVSVAVAALYICSIQHARGMFDIVGHRIETMFDDINNGVLCNENEKMVASIMFHTKAMEFTDMLNSIYGPLYLTEVSLLVLLLSGNIFRLFQAYVRSNGVVICAMHVAAVLTCMLVLSVTGQELLDRSSKVFVKAYESQWYLAPTSMQKSLVFIMARSLKESSIKITRSIFVSFELLVSILQMSVSYFMAMCSLQ